jgi:hypothetical protein
MLDSGTSTLHNSPQAPPAHALESQKVAMAYLAGLELVSFSKLKKYSQVVDEKTLIF